MKKGRRDKGRRNGKKGEWEKRRRGRLRKSGKEWRRKKGGGKDMVEII